MLGCTRSAVYQRTCGLKAAPVSEWRIPSIVAPEQVSEPGSAQQYEESAGDARGAPESQAAAPTGERTAPPSSSSSSSSSSRRPSTVGASGHADTGSVAGRELGSSLLGPHTRIAAVMSRSQELGISPRALSSQPEPFDIDYDLDCNHLIICLDRGIRERVLEQVEPGWRPYYEEKASPD